MIYSCHRRWCWWWAILLPLLHLTSVSSETNYEQVLHWNDQYQQNSKTLNTLQKLHSSSAVLHFIELTHNFTAEDLANCERVSLSSLNFTINPQSYRRFTHQAEIATRTAHFLTNLFSPGNGSHEQQQHHSITNKDLYWSLLLANLQSNPHIFAAGIALTDSFVSSIATNFKHFTPYIYRNVRANDTIRTNLASHKLQSVQGSDGASETVHSEWYWKLALPNYNAITARWLEASGNNGDSSGVWSSPYLDCGITKTWLITYVVPFYKITVGRSTLV